MASSLSKSKQILFSLLTLGLVLTLAEGGTRFIQAIVTRLAIGQPSSPYVAYQNVQNVFTTSSSSGTDYFVRTQYHPYVLSSSRFRVEKPPGTFRVFCLGGSAALGWPHLPAQSYPAFLEKKLQLLYPNQTFEVINVAASTYASYRVKTIFDEIIHYDPDLILLYTGNNEFLEKVLYQPTSPLGSPWNYSALIRTIHQGWTHFRAKEAKQVIDIENYRPTFLLDAALGHTAALKVSEEQYQQTTAHYRYNLTTMISAAQQHSVPMVLLTVPVNVRHWHPHASVHRAGLDSILLQQWQRALAAGIQTFQAQQYDRALPHFLRALKIDDQHAELLYYVGKTYEYLGEPALSRTHLTRSLIADAYPFRALPHFNQLLHTVSQEYRVPLADIERVFVRNSPRGVIGEELLVDHVHPTVASNQLIADEVLQTLWKAGILPNEKEINTSAVRLPIPSQAEATLPLMQHLFLIYRVLLQFDKMDTLYQRCTDLPDYEKNTDQYQAFMQKFDHYLTIMRPYQRLLLAQKTGRAQEEFTPEETAAIVEKYVSMSQQSLAVRMSKTGVSASVPSRKNNTVQKEDLGE